MAITMESLAAMIRSGQPFNATDLVAENAETIPSKDRTRFATEFLANWLRLDETRDVIRAVSDTVFIPVEDLIENKEDKSVWLHPDLLIPLVMSIDPRLHVRLMGMLLRGRSLEDLQADFYAEQAAKKKTHVRHLWRSLNAD